MHETEADLEAMQALLDRSYDAGGPHLHRIRAPSSSPA